MIFFCCLAAWDKKKKNQQKNLGLSGHLGSYLYVIVFKKRKKNHVFYILFFKSDELPCEAWSAPSGGIYVHLELYFLMLNP